MATFPSYTPKIPTIKAVQWTNDPEVVDDLRIWLNQNYGPETPGLIAEFGESNELSPPGPRGWEIAEDTRLFVKQSEDHFWLAIGDWLILQQNVGEPNELAPMSNEQFVEAYEEK